MEEQLLRDEKTFPAASILSRSLGKTTDTYNEFIRSVTKNVFHLSQEWRYYKDGKAWLSKITHKKKTVCWLSVWKGFFRLAFYFTEKTIQGVHVLDIDRKIKNGLKGKKSIGKLIPVVIEVRYRKQLPDILELVKYKIEVL